MASAKQLAANRANSRKSTGPITEAGKLNSRLNSYKHGLSGHTILRTPEQDASYNTFRARLYPDLAPANAVEHDFAERIIYDSWRIHRASAIESNLYALADPAFDAGNLQQDDALNDAHTFLLNDKAINLLSLYQQRLQRGVHKHLAMLRQMQKERRAEALKASAKPAVHLIEKPAPPPVIGSACPPLPEPSSPSPPAVSNDPSNMAA